MRSLLCLFSILTLATGCVLEGQPVGNGDAGICGSCPADTPACNEAVPECVQCTTDNSSACVDDTTVCNPDTFTCVQCTTNTQCNAPDKARCDTDTNECAQCEGRADCNNITGLPECNNGTCVECTPATEETDCDETSCDPLTSTCTNTMLASRETCETCVADSECKDNHRCVPMNYKGTRHPNGTTGYCLKSIALGGSCTNPYRIVINATSLSGTPDDDYCGINEALATCEAVQALLNDVQCDPDNDDSDCPQPGGICRELRDLRDTCTYLCSGPPQCDEEPNPGAGCGSSGTGSDNYCGG